MMEPWLDPKHRFEEEPFLDSQQHFDDARWEATVRSLLRVLLHQSVTLVPFEPVRTHLGEIRPVARDLQIIPLEGIVGSVERYHDFTREFLPRSEDLRERWQRIARATLRLETLPPIDVYQLGQVYFVRDGNHRVSVARFNGTSTIEANVTEIPLKGTLTPDMDVNQIILTAESSNFLSRTHLDELRPETEIRFTAPGGYAELLEHIDVRRWYLGIERKAEVGYLDAVMSWHDTVFQPAAEAIRYSGLLANFPKRTAADLYLWTMRHLAELKEEYSPLVDTQMAADDLAREYTGDRLKQALHDVQKKAHNLLQREDVPPIIDELIDKLAEQERAAGEETDLNSPDAERKES